MLVISIYRRTKCNAICKIYSTYMLRMYLNKHSFVTLHILLGKKFYKMPVLSIVFTIKAGGAYTACVHQVTFGCFYMYTLYTIEHKNVCFSIANIAVNVTFKTYNLDDY
jgi:hypothetical protein